MVKIPAKHRFGVAAAVASALGAGAAAALALVPSASAEDATYRLILTDPPAGVNSVAVASPAGYLGCYPVTSNYDTQQGVADGDVLLAEWYSDSNCRSSMNRISRVTVGFQGIDEETFRFLLGSTVTDPRTP